MRLYTHMLGACTIDAIVLSCCQLEIAGIVEINPSIQRPQGLNDSLAISGFTNQNTTVIVFDCTGENLRCRGTVSVNQYDERASPFNGRIFVVNDNNVSRRVPNLNDRT